MHQHYMIEGSRCICPRDINGPEYKNPNLYPEFQKKLQWLKKILLEKYIKNEAFVILRVFDGEFYFLDKIKIGNVGRRHCSKELTDDFVKKFKDGCYKVDILCTQLYEDKLQHYKRLFPDKNFDIPMELIYGLFANRWILSSFRNNIALIGGEEKMKVIKNLMKREEYRNYVRNDKFLDYIGVPEKYSSDNPENILNLIGPQIQKSSAKVFLFGIGIAKMAIAYKFKEYKNALFIDIGCGISALAGTTSNERPYFGDWINYRLKNYKYSKMDTMDFKLDKDIVKVLD